MVSTTQITNTPNQAVSTVPHVIVIGGGFGGLQAAKALGKLAVRVMVIDKQNSHVFQPMLYQVATAGLSPADIATPIRHILRKQHNTEVVMEQVTGIDMQEQRVLMHNQALHYDYLIIATGASNNYFHHPEWQQHAPGLKSLADALEIRRTILNAFEAAEREPDEEKRRELLTFVLVGGGPTGVELAGALAELVQYTLRRDFQHIRPEIARIVLVEGESRIIPTFPASLTSKARRKLQEMGVEIRSGVHVEEIHEDYVMIGDQKLATRNVIWTAGVKASPAGQWLHAQVDHDGRVKVQPDLTLPDHQNVFVIGDTALVMQNGKPLPGVAPVALQEGRYVAKVIADRLAGRTNTPAFHYYDKGMLATVGRSFGIVDVGPFHFTGLFAWIFWLFVHIFFLIGFRNRIAVLFQYAWEYFTYQRGARIILATDDIRSARSSTSARERRRHKAGTR
ncbi:MAG TPA: NAD(P)/FAD-dependent oxidoreductase [Ktedonobacteraceae bacterium]|nr:NAD(P)/FAD-dependent oxidoreductase [Ktedonobacteraceae bacterium]